MTNVLLQRAMFNAGHTTTSLAQRAGVSPDTVARALRGEQLRGPSAKKIADVFEVQPTSLFPLGNGLDPSDPDLGAAA